MLCDFKEGMLEWKKLPDDQPIVFNGEEAIPYISTEGKYKFAILKDGQFIDSIYMASRCHTKYVDYSDCSKIERCDIFRVMALRGELRKIGWIDERPYKECDNIISASVRTDALGECERELFDVNFLLAERDHIVLLAIEAYQVYINLISPKKSFRLQMEKYCNSFGSCDTPSDVMKLALYIALINPAIGRPWRNVYNKQGARNTSHPQSDLDVMLNLLREKLSGEMNVHYCMRTQLHPDNQDVINEFCIWTTDELMALTKVIAVLERDSDRERIELARENKVQIDAIQLVKAKLTSMGILCSTNVVEQEWVQFVAAAWGVTPSQVVSAAKALKRRESQEQK